MTPLNKVSHIFLVTFLAKLPFFIYVAYLDDKINKFDTKALKAVWITYLVIAIAGHAGLYFEMR